MIMATSPKCNSCFGKQSDNIKLFKYSKAKQYRLLAEHLAMIFLLIFFRRFHKEELTDLDDSEGV